MLVLALANSNLGQEAGISSRIIVAYGEGGLQRGVGPGEGAISIAEDVLGVAGIHGDVEMESPGHIKAGHSVSFLIMGPMMRDGDGFKCLQKRNYV